VTADRAARAVEAAQNASSRDADWRAGYQAAMDDLEERLHRRTSEAWDAGWDAGLDHQEEELDDAERASWAAGFAAGRDRLESTERCGYEAGLRDSAGVIAKLRARIAELEATDE
jgi:hypothetical protein